MQNDTDDAALLLFAHGSADPGWATPFTNLLMAMRERRPGKIVELAYLERMRPDFDEAVDALHARGVRHVTVAPLFLALGGHMRKDLPLLINAASDRTGISFRVLPALGEVDSLIESIANWVDCAARKEVT